MLYNQQNQRSSELCLSLSKSWSQFIKKNVWFHDVLLCSHVNYKIYATQFQDLKERFREAIEGKGIQQPLYDLMQDALSFLKKVSKLCRFMFSFLFHLFLI